MLSRTLSTAIVLFWITMTALLMRSEIWPGRSALRTVPIEHVGKLLWHHQQTSDLTIWSEGIRVGHFKLQPTVQGGGDARVLEYSGSLQVRLPGSGRQRVSWNGIAEFDRTSSLRSLLLRLPFQESSSIRSEILFIPAENRATYRQVDGERQVESEDYQLDESGLRKVIDQLGLDPVLLEAFRGSRQMAGEFTAEQSSLMIHHARIDTYRLALKLGGQTVMEAHINELGRVLQVKSIIGYTMAPDDMAP